MKNQKYKILITILTMHTYAAGEPSLPFKDTYFGLNAAHSLNTKKVDAVKENGYKSAFPSFDLMLGGKVTDNYRLEIAAGYRDFKYKHDSPTYDNDGIAKENHNLSLYTLMINNYYDFNITNDKFTPYIMAGAGISKPKSNNASTQALYNDGTTATASEKIKASPAFAYQVGFGVDMKLAKNVNADFGIRHVNYGTVTMIGDGAKTKAKLKSNEVIVGLKYHF